MGNLLIAVPTYNERDNVERLITEITALNLDADLLFVDDNSPDGTGELLESLKPRFPRLSVEHRAGKQGVGSAHVHAIKLAYARGYKRLMTMDCDFTHPPSRLPELLAASRDHDVVVGSRFMRRDSLPGWVFYRKVLTYAGHLMTVVLLRMPYDATGALRFYNLETIPEYAWNTVTSMGYGFFFESLYVLFFNKFRVAQIPIQLPARTYGHSKMDHREVLRSVKLLFAVFMTTLLNPERYQIVEPLPAGSLNPEIEDVQGWEGYWKSKAKVGGVIYNSIAAFYRKFIIRGALNHFIKKHFPRKAEVLHAGCGSGQVDIDIRNYVNITGLDISVEALSFYRQTNRDNCRTIHGSIFKIPLPQDSVDGIYNLGVMEHFTEPEIHTILGEFHRVLKPNGKAVMFWPPEFGLSVIFFKVLTVIFKAFGKKNVKFHPDEITRVRSKEHVRKLLEAADFSVVDYYFGIRDFFTYSVIAVQKR